MFGMGTGGSLRLLSPETKLSLDSVAAAFLLSSLRPSNGLASSFSQRRNRFYPHPQNCTGSSSVHRLTKAFPFTLSETSSFCFSQTLWLLDQALDRLVSSSSIRYRTSTDDLSTLSSSRGLTCSKQWQFSSPGGLHA